jgi:thiamine biosynthesis protein ThiS
MTVNGASYPHQEGLTLPMLLATLDVDARKVVVMVGDEIYRGAELADVPVAPDDTIEIVTMMQGG